VPLSHLFLGTFLRDGHHAVDATCGNGNDTLLLAQLVGRCGHVWGFDIQREAIVETGRRLVDAELMERTTLLHAGHEALAQHITVPLQAVVFNLGYLPGGDRSVITRPDTTVTALQQSLPLLSSGGIVLVTIYPGHCGGPEEQSAIEAWAGELQPRDYHCWRLMQTNATPAAPYLLLVQKAL
jgi:predicted O-methyltransferase YrrM